MSRKLTVEAFKYNPLSKISKPYFVTYELGETPFMTAFVCLTLIRKKMDADLSFDSVYRAGICGSRAMMTNGVPKLVCKILTKDYSDGVIEPMPMPTFRHIKDLSVNTGEWLEDMCKCVESWVHNEKEIDTSKIEGCIESEVAEETFEPDRRVECGTCVASCATKLMYPNFIAATGFLRTAGYLQDPHDHRTVEDFYELVGDDDGVSGRMSLLVRENNCPKSLPLQSRVAYMRRRLVAQKNK